MCTAHAPIRLSLYKQSIQTLELHMIHLIRFTKRTWTSTEESIALLKTKFYDCLLEKELESIWNDAAVVPAMGDNQPRQFKCSARYVWCICKHQTNLALHLNKHSGSIDDGICQTKWAMTATLRMHCWSDTSTPSNWGKGNKLNVKKKKLRAQTYNLATLHSIYKREHFMCACLWFWTLWPKVVSSKTSDQRTYQKWR